MSQWQGKSKGNPLGYRIFVFVCTHLGITPAYWLLRFVAFYYLVFSFTSNRSTYHYFRSHHHFSRWKSILSIYRNYYLLGQTLIDKVVIMADIPNRFTFHFDGVENLNNIVSEGKGGILISAHVGNWEAAGHLLKHLNARINIVMFDGEHQKIKAFLDSVTGEKNFHIIVVKDDISHIYEIGQALQKNEIVCLHADRFLKGNKTVSHSFLGKEALFPYGPFVIAATFKVPVSFVFAFKETSTHYHLYGSKPIKFDMGLKKAEVIEKLFDEFVMVLEEKVKKYPEQWFNYYNFWE